MSYEKVNQPLHYQSKSGQSALDIIHDFDLNFNLGNTLKYVIRAGKKPDAEKIDDLKKAIFYLEYELLLLQPSLKPRNQKRI